MILEGGDFFKKMEGQMTSKGIPKQGWRRRWGGNNATWGSFYQTLLLQVFF